MNPASTPMALTGVADHLGRAVMHGYHGRHGKAGWDRGQSYPASAVTSSLV